MRNILYRGQWRRYRGARGRVEMRECVEEGSTLEIMTTTNVISYIDRRLLAR